MTSRFENGILCEVYAKAVPELVDDEGFWFRLNRKLTSWKSLSDPSMGDFVYELDRRGLPEMVLRNGSAKLFRTGSWNGFQFSGTPEVKNNSIFKPVFVMREIPDTEISFPHRAGYLYMISNTMQQNEGSSNDQALITKNLRRLYKYMTPYVPQSPRAAYVNVRDLELGMWTNYTPSYEEAKIWGSKYFKNNFNRLVKVTSRVDPDNFFREEQSIPPNFS
ncbi:hypothetical protein Syun_021998 [Stephania yunnanensis]|uniref:Berberine/berberine-like domain-containing protein n=1 Tax=Stephania yunnanensis TaxID=152371 RepID=A0AAP0II39_9MAGN